MQHIGVMWLPRNDYDFTQFAVTGEYQRTVFDRACAHVTTWDRAIDIGAHVGFWARALAARFRVVDGFEPIAENVACLTRNVPPSVSIHPVALGAARGVLELCNRAPVNSGAWTAGTPGLQVPLRPLDEYRFWEQGSIGLVKIDVQGMEPAVLLGARETLKHTHPVVIVEVECDGQRSDDSLRVLEAFGARIVDRFKADCIAVW